MAENISGLCQMSKYTFYIGVVHIIIGHRCNCLPSANTFSSIQMSNKAQQQPGRLSAGRDTNRTTEDQPSPSISRTLWPCPRTGHQLGMFAVAVLEVLVPQQALQSASFLQTACWRGHVRWWTRWRLSQQWLPSAPSFLAVLAELMQH